MRLASSPVGDVIARDPWGDQVRDDRRDGGIELHDPREIDERCRHIIRAQGLGCIGPNLHVDALLVRHLRYEAIGRH